MYKCLVYIVAILLIILVNLGLFWVIMSLWNWIAPLFWVNAPILTYWEAAGCVILLQIIGNIFYSTQK